MDENIQIKTKGSIGELMTYAKLLSLGWEVYPNLDDVNGIDCIIRKDNRLLKIQIKSAYKSQKVKNKLNPTIIRDRCGFKFTKHTDFDFVICKRKEEFFIIPKKQINGSEAIFIYENSTRSRFDRYKNNFDFNN